MNKLKYLLLTGVIVVICFSCSAQTVSLQGKNFYLNGQLFYPKGVDYSVVIVKDNNCNPGTYFVAPDAGYTNNEFYAQLPPYDQNPNHYCCRDASLAGMDNDFSVMASYGVNCIRLVGLGPYYDANSNQMLFNYTGCPEWPPQPGIGTLGGPIINQSNATVINYFSMIQDVLNKAAKYNMKVMLLAGGGSGVFSSAGSNVYASYLSVLSANFSTNTTLFSYDLCNEPNYTPVAETMDKNAICDWTATQNNAIHSNTSTQYVTIGDGMSDLAANWDPSIMNIDFVCFHPYGSTNQPYYAPTVQYITDRVLNEIIWYGNNISMPWMLSETGFAAATSPYFNSMDDGTITDQTNFVTQTMNAVRAMGGAGYLYWQHGGENWGIVNADDIGLEQEQYPTNLPPNWPQLKPASNSILNFNALAIPAPVTKPSNYYNYYNWPGPCWQGSVTDQNGNPIADAKVVAWDYHWSSSYSTFTASDGSFCLYAFNNLFHFTANAISYWNNNGIITTNGFTYSNINLSLTSFSDDRIDLSNQTVNNTQSIIARNEITAGNNYYVVPSSGNVTLESGKEIDLYNGFQAQKGCYFDAKYGILYNCSTVNGNNNNNNARYTNHNDGGGSNNSSSSNLVNFILKEPNQDSIPTISIYPNPTVSGHLTVNISSSADFSKVEVTDILGNSVFVLQNPQNTTMIDLSKFTRGVYIIRITGEKNTFIKKIVYE